MFKVIIVDDEYLIRSLIKTSVDFAALNYEVVGEAEDGEQALELIDALTPDLIILDINIPFLNGVDLAKIVREKHPDLKIIVLTGYGEFEYAKEFIKIGVSDYVLKPLQPEAFAEVLLQVRAELNQRIEQQRYLEKLERDAEQSTDMLKAHYLIEILEEVNRSEAEMVQQLAAFYPDFNTTNIVVISGVIDDLERKYRHRGQRSGVNNALYNIASDYLAQWRAAICFFDAAHRLTLLVNAQRDDLADIVEGCEAIADEVKRTLNLTLSLGISQAGQSYAAVPTLYQQAVYALEERFFGGEGAINIYGRVGLRGRTREPLLVRSKGDILPQLRTANRAGFVQLLRDLEIQIAAAHPEIENVYAAYGELVVEIMKYAWENNVRTDEIFPEGINYIDGVRVNQTLSDLTVWMIGLYDSVTDHVLSKSRRRPNQIVERAKLFIDANYVRSDLSIEEVAERIFINPSHLSKIFKREMKSSMIEYLTQLRMKSAKEILDAQPDIQISDVAQQTGYDDPFYFSKLFRKMFGLSPSQYVRSKTQRNLS